jgi:hypothetical protein
MYLDKVRAVIYAQNPLQCRICVCGASKLKLHYPENLLLPLFAKEGNYSSLRQREVRRDFIYQRCHYFEAVNNSWIIELKEYAKG